MDVAHAAPIDNERLGRPTEHVDKAGRNRQPTGIDLGLTQGPGLTHGRHPRPHVDYAVAVDTDIADITGAARSVIDRPAPDDHVINRVSRDARRSIGPLRASRHGEQNQRQKRELLHGLGRAAGVGYWTVVH